MSNLYNDGTTMTPDLQVAALFYFAVGLLGLGMCSMTSAAQQLLMTEAIGNDLRSPYNAIRFPKILSFLPQYCAKAILKYSEQDQENST